MKIIFFLKTYTYTTDMDEVLIGGITKTASLRSARGGVRIFLLLLRPSASDLQTKSRCVYSEHISDIMYTPTEVRCTHVHIHTHIHGTHK